jgi:hypothetical protein
MPKNPEKELEEFLAPLPAWLKAALEQKDYSFATVQENLEWINNQNRVTELRPEFERILRRIPAQWNEYCKRFRENQRRIHETEKRFLNVPKGKPGRPPDSKAQDYFEQHSGDSSYADIAKQELQSVPEGEAKTLLIPKERERIRASVRRARRRQSE